MTKYSVGFGGKAGNSAGIPLLGLGMLIRSYSEVENEHRSHWDAKANSIVSGRAVAGWQIVGIVVGTVLVVAIKIYEVIISIAD
ncbi:hypothetical protein [Allosphingosinicella sp.]|uniref:hypothetical protein n=1 Tax=Allosphingosinicella sp. TaxID=2823234 RepID=UPI002FC12A3F